MQFVIPGLAVREPEQADFLKLTERLGCDVHSAAIQSVANESKQIGTQVSIAFYVLDAATDEAISADVDDTAIVIVERFLGMLSFLAGVRFVAAHTQTTQIKGDGSTSTKIEPRGRSGETRVSFELPKDPFGGRRPTDNIFIALFWMRRALAERDPLDTYAALMVALQTIARDVVSAKQTARTCSNCGHVSMEERGVSATVRDLVVGSLGASPDLFNRLWKARNAVIAHGNQAVSAGTFLQLTELKFEAADLCYKGIKLSLGLPVEGPPRLDPSFFVTSALMYVE